MGLLDYLQTDPNKQDALRMGLLNAGIAMMANQSPNFLGALGQGAASGVSAYQKQFDEAKRKAAMNASLLAAQTPAKDAVPESYKVGGTPYKTMAEAQKAASPYMTTLPQLGPSNSPLMPNVAQASQPAQPTMLANNGPFADMAHTPTAVPVNNDSTAMLSPQQDVQMPGQQIETVPGQPAQDGGFDFAKMAQHILSSPDAPPELQDMALKYYASQKPTEQFAKIDPKDYTPASVAAFAQTGNHAVLVPVRKLENWGGNVVDPYAVAPGKTINDPNKPFNPDGTPNLAYQDFEKGKAKAGAPSMTSINNINAYEPFKNKVQATMGEGLVKNYETLQSIPQTLKALDAAKQYAKQAGNFAGSGGDTKLAIAKFFNNNLGTNIDPAGVKNAEALKSALFYNVMDNLKKMDASPSQQQQQVMQAAFGKLDTDPGALPMIIDFYKGQLLSKAAEHNRRVDQTTSGPAGMQFPYDIHVKIPQEAQPQPKPTQAFTLPPNAKQYQGKILRDTQTGKRFQSVNGRWQELK